MKYFGLIWKNAWRKKIRTSLTILSVLVAFLLFFLLSAIGKAMTGGGATIESAKRLVVIDKVSLINLLPIAYQNRIAAIPGVESVAQDMGHAGFDALRLDLAATQGKRFKRLHQVQRLHFLQGVT